MNTAEIVKSEMKAERGPQVLPLLAKAVRQACQSAHLHSHCEILAFHDGCANASRVWIPEDWDSLRRNHFGRRVAAFAFGRGAIDLDQLRETCSISESVLDGERIARESIGGDLIRFRRSRQSQTLDESICRCLIPLVSR
jgi:AcrR family transcriptional regulator